jgi:hypothetical protein
MQKSVVEDSCWEQRLHLVVHILLRSLSVATALEQLNKQTSNTIILIINPQHIINTINISKLTLIQQVPLLLNV